MDPGPERRPRLASSTVGSPAPSGPPSSGGESMYTPFSFYRDYTLKHGPFVLSSGGNNNNNNNKTASSPPGPGPSVISRRPPANDATVSLVVVDKTGGSGQTRHFVMSCALDDVNRLVRLLAPPGSSRKAAVISPDGKWRDFKDLTRALLPGWAIQLGIISV